jgi:transposase
MDEWTEIRRKVLVEGVSKRSILRDYNVGHQALAKILANAEPPGYQMAEARKKPVLGPFLGVIDEILAADTEAPPKQRHTARRIFERLRDEYGYKGSYSQVQTAVQSAKRYSKEAFVPLSHPPGHAQFDFGEATVEIAGERCKAALGVITLPYSDTYFIPASAPRPSRPPTWPASSSSAACPCASPMTTPPSPSARSWAVSGC